MRWRSGLCYPCCVLYVSLFLYNCSVSLIHAAKSPGNSQPIKQPRLSVKPLELSTSPHIGGLTFDSRIEVFGMTSARPFFWMVQDDVDSIKRREFLEILKNAPPAPNPESFFSDSNSSSSLAGNNTVEMKVPSTPETKLESNPVNMKNSNKNSTKFQNKYPNVNLPSLNSLKDSEK